MEYYHSGTERNKIGIRSRRKKFVKEHFDSNCKYTECMFENFPTDSQHSNGRNCDTLQAHIFDVEFVQF